MRIVDLSQDIYEGMQVYPGHLKTVQFEHATHEENLAHLDQVVNTRFTFAGFPLKLRGAHGGPTRAVALVG
jgi:kynurenine formamidase